MQYSAAEENYIKAIYRLQDHAAMVTTNALADALQTKPPSVTDMLKKLKAKKLLNYEPYKGVKLSAEGKKVALAVVRKHRLWESFLVSKLQFGWDEVHEVAEELEHITSKKLIDKLDAFLGFPRFDPHGDPIPDSQGRITIQPQVRLTELPLHQSAEISAVGSQSPALLELLKAKGLQLGTRLDVRKIFSFDRSLDIRIKQQASVNISFELASVLFVKTC
ncbi:MAG: metal-dependent transcriptional regulator [Chitinophagaceae bacterium]|nr:metal-dependent transcriptional regulator [Chitinophagaceae bacterium]